MKIILFWEQINYKVEFLFFCPIAVLQNFYGANIAVIVEGATFMCCGYAILIEILHRFFSFYMFLSIFIYRRSLLWRIIPNFAPQYLLSAGPFSGNNF